jgi:hypothetical protein
MGLLDDAIREHLELKRQRGADASEIDRLEHEALGPVRRQPLESPDRESDSEAEVDHRSGESQRTDELTEADYEEYYDEEDSGEAETGDWGEPFEEGFERPGSRASRAEPPPTTSDRESSEPPSAPEQQGERGFRRWRRSRRESVPPEDAPPTQAEPPERPPRGDETVEYGVEDSLGARGGETEKGRAAGRASSEEEEDVLEETPEFLQDAPEHDRLWFEQRPPRDFDFDD